MNLIARYICVVGIFHISTDASIIDPAQVKLVVRKIEKNLKKVFEDVTHAHKLINAFERLDEEKEIVVKKLNVSQVSEEFNENLKTLFLSQISSVNNIKHKAESLYNNYKYDKNIKAFDYLNDKTVPPDAVREEPTFFHGIKLNINRSHVQLPANIYDKHKAILNVAKWSQGLDESLLNNFNKTPTLLWQYFGSEIGMLRTFPGYR